MRTILRRAKQTVSDVAGRLAGTAEGEQLRLAVADLAAVEAGLVTTHDAVQIADRLLTPPAASPASGEPTVAPAGDRAA